MKILVTGAAGFIGAALCLKLLNDGYTIIGVDNLNDYYSRSLKQKRLDGLQSHAAFSFHQVDLCEPEALARLPDIDGVTRVVHLAGQAGVRFSIEQPFPYMMSNIVGHLTVLEYCRRAEPRPVLIYASSSSVYGAPQPAICSENEPVGEPTSFYALTKQTDEAMSRAYASLYGVRQLGVRLFTVYGPWGRPDMAYWIFTRNALLGLPIQLFNGGNMMRDFTYIDDAVAGLSAMIEAPGLSLTENAPHRILNLGSGQAVPLAALVDAVSQATGREIVTEPHPMQAGDLKHTCADIETIKSIYGYTPKTSLTDGVARFVEWFRTDPELTDYSAKSINREKS